MKKGALVLASLLLSVALPASAAEVADPNDSASKLDISSVKATGQDNTLGTFVITMYDRWGSRFLRDAKPTTLKLYLDDGADGDADLVGNFRYRNGELMVFLKGPDSGNMYEPVPATRPTDSSVRVRFPLDLTELGSDSLRAFARSVSSELSDCPGDPCKDRAPNGGGVQVH